MKTLFIIRHAKSSWKDENISDFERPLNKRGKHDAPLMGDVLRKLNVQPDKIISSPAKRAIITAGEVVKKIHYSNNDILKDTNIYHAGISELTEIVSNFSNNWKTVFLFGHNPGLTYLAEYFSGEYYGNIPTCGVTAIEFDVDEWEAISKNSGNKIFYDYPKNH